MTGNEVGVQQIVFGCQCRFSQMSQSQLLPIGNGVYMLPEASKAERWRDFEQAEQRHMQGCILVRDLRFLGDGCEDRELFAYKVQTRSNPTLGLTSTLLIPL